MINARDTFSTMCRKASDTKLQHPAAKEIPVSRGSHTIAYSPQKRESNPPPLIVTSENQIFQFMWHLFNKYSGHCPIPTYWEDLAKRSPKYVLKGGHRFLSQIAEPQGSNLEMATRIFWHSKSMTPSLDLHCQGAPLPPGVCYHLCFWSLRPLMSLFPHLMSRILGEIFSSVSLVAT